jgi:hypothetical protein
VTQYDAFISYRRSDGRAVANWLRRELERFRPPKKLAHLAGKRLRVYLDTAYERGTNDFYEHSIRPALLTSRYLIVIATPDALTSPAGKEDWMRRELIDFANGPNAANVLAVRGAGEFPGLLPTDLAERFPNIEVVDLRGAGPFAFLNPFRATRLADEKLKLLASLLDVPLEDVPALRLEEERQQQTKLGAAAGVTFAVFSLVAGASVFAFKSLWTAREAFESSMFSTERMISAISDGIPSEDTPYGVRGVLLNQACDLIDKLAQEAANAPSIRERVLCEIERARGREAQKEHALAEATLAAAVQLARAEAKRTRSSPAGRALVEARIGMADYLQRVNAPDKAEAALGALLGDAQRLAVDHPNEPYFLIAQAEAYVREASWVHSGADPAAELAAIDQAVLLIGKAASHRETLPEQLTHVLPWQADLLSQAANAALTLNDQSRVLQYLREAVRVRNKIDWSRANLPAEGRAGNEISIAELYIAIAAIEAAQRRFARSREAMAQAGLRVTAVANQRGLPANLGARIRETRRKLDELKREINFDSSPPRAGSRS